MATSDSRVPSRGAAGGGPKKVYPIRDAFAIGAIIFLVAIASVYYTTEQAYNYQLDSARNDLFRMARGAASAIDGDLHSTLKRPDQFGGSEYRAALDALLRFRAGVPEAAYLYTMAEKNGQLYFVLDTSSVSNSAGHAKPSHVPKFMEPRHGPSPSEEARIIQTLNTGQIYLGDMPANDASGTFLTGAAPILNSKGQPVGAVGVDLDLGDLLRKLHNIRLAGFAGVGISVLAAFVTGLIIYIFRSRAANSDSYVNHIEEVRKRLEERNVLLIRALGQIVYHADLRTGAIEWSGQTELLRPHGGGLAASLDDWLEDVDPADRPALLEERRISTNSGGVLEQEYRMVVRSGSLRWFHDRGIVSYDTAGQPAALDGILYDIQDRRQEQSELTKLAFIANHTDNGVVMTDRSGLIEWVNDGFERISGYTHAEVKGRKPGELLQGPDTDPEAVQTMREAIASGKDFSVDVLNYTKSGKPYWVHVEAQVIRDADGAVTNFMALQSDITQRKRFEQELISSKEAAERANRAKSEFLAVMSHEIRTPMNGIIGFTNLLCDSPLNPLQLEFVETIRASGESLLMIINDILDFSKMESGKLDLEIEPIELRRCIEETLDLYAHTSSVKSIELIYDIKHGTPEWIYGDFTRLKQVLVNLVGNAVKFTDTGEVEVVVETAGPIDPAGGPRLVVRVRDTGIGITPDQVERLFSPFSQADSSTTRKYGGTGLGLAICKKLLVLMDGAIAIDPGTGMGATFTFWIPLREAPAQQHAVARLPAAGDEHPLTGRRALLIDDNPTNLRVLRELLSRWGIEVVALEHPQRAIAELGGSHFDVIITDMMMPEMDGVELARQIRRTFADSPIILLTSIGGSGREYLEEKPQLFQFVLSKPIHVSALRLALDRAIFPAQQPAPETGAGPVVGAGHIPEAALRILVAEDNAVNRKVVQRMLSNLGYPSDAVENGALCLDACRQKEYDMIFMDVQMPVMDGFTATLRLRELGIGIWITALTAGAMPDDRKKCLDAGMDDYLSKPLRFEDLRGAIERYLEHAGKTRGAG